MTKRSTDTATRNNSGVAEDPILAPGLNPYPSYKDSGVEWSGSGTVRLPEEDAKEYVRTRFGALRT